MAPSLFGSRHLGVTRASFRDLSRRAPIMGRRRRTRVLSGERDPRVRGRRWMRSVFTLADTHRMGRSRGLIRGLALVRTCKHALDVSAYVITAVGMRYFPRRREKHVENATVNAAGHRPRSEKRHLFPAQERTGTTEKP